VNGKKENKKKEKFVDFPITILTRVNEGKKFRGEISGQRDY
jgi:hypothetical protein